MKRLFLLATFAMLAQIKPVGISKNVTTASTAVALVSTRTLARSLTIQAKVGNTGSICVGGLSSASCTGGGPLGIVLSPGSALAYNSVGEAKVSNYYDLSAIYIDSTVNGEGVLITYVLP